jgi:hypothetical protein
MGRDDVLKIEVRFCYYFRHCILILNLTSGLVLLHLPRGDLIPAESVKVLHLDVVLLAVVVAPHPLDVDVVVTFPLARMNAEIGIETTIDETVVETALAAPMTGEIHISDVCISCL